MTKSIRQGLSVLGLLSYKPRDIDKNTQVQCFAFFKGYRQWTHESDHVSSLYAISDDGSLCCTYVFRARSS